ncbi:MAG: aryl-sulfate sulfotransferase [Candidatus Zixiibacteriota bacterium]
MNRHRFVSGATGLFVSALILSFFLTHVTQAQDQTVGLFLNDTAAFEGYTFFAPMTSTETYLIDMFGREVHSWTSTYTPGASAYLLENGHVLRTAKFTPQGAGAGGKVEEIDWDGTILWDFVYYDSTQYLQHHDIEPLPNGNVLILAWEFKSDSEAIAMGRDPALLFQEELWPEQIVEVEPSGLTGGNIIWEWHFWDHLIQDFDSTKANYGVLADHPELLDINFADAGLADWIHANSIDYSPELDQIVISSRRQHEVWIIDHSTTSAEAASHSGGNNGKGGDLLYRWGNPKGYDRGDSTDQMLYGQHDAHWIPSGLQGEGHLLIFNNGQDRGWSSVDEIITPVDGNGNYPTLAPGVAFGPAAPVWTYEASPPESLFAQFISGAQRLPNNNTLICSGPNGTFFEVDTSSQTVWKYVSPIQAAGPMAQGSTAVGTPVFRSYRFGPDFPGLIGRNLTAGSALELYPITVSGTGHNPQSPMPFESVVITATITDTSTLVITDLIYDSGSGPDTLTMFDDGNHNDGAAGDDLYGAVIPALPEGTTVEYYLYVENNVALSRTDPPNPPSTVYRYTVVPSCCFADRGDVNGDGADLDIVDLTCMADFLFGAGCAMPCDAEADVNGDSAVADIVDLTFVVDWLFGIAPTLVACP